VTHTIPVTDITDRQRRNFSCGVDALDDYLKRYSKFNHVNNIGKTFVLLDDGDVSGYYTTSMGNANFSSIPLEFRKRLPKYPVPFARIARLAVYIKKQKQGWGEFLLTDALHRIHEANSLVAAYGVVVDAKDENAKSFYLKFGFVPFNDSDLCLFLPIASIPL
jgi:ribosomal protein S18 acetylase RimI-like enzyme